MSQELPNQALPSARSPIDERGDLDDLPLTGITVVVAVLGLLLFMAIPMNIQNPAKRIAAQRARISFLALERFKTAVEDYRGDHGAWPGQDASFAHTLAEPSYNSLSLVRQLQMHSDQDGTTLPSAEAGYSFGPYLPDGIPINPENHLSTVRVLQPGESIDRVLDGIYGWVYDPRTGEVTKHQFPFQKPSSRQARSNARSY
jgi:hypothetical protein